MNSIYLKRLAMRADPEKLWRQPFDLRNNFTPEQRLQLDTGIALNRAASLAESLEQALKNGKSFLITPTSSMSQMTSEVETPAGDRTYRGSLPVN
jgi:hypothetical protein